MLLLLIIGIVLGIGVYCLLSTGAGADKKHMISWEKCDGNCSNCRDAGQCMNRPY